MKSFLWQGQGGDDKKINLCLWFNYTSNSVKCSVTYFNHCVGFCFNCQSSEKEED